MNARHEHSPTGGESEHDREKVARRQMHPGDPSQTKASATRMRNASPPKASLLGLPGELRNTIYDSVGETDVTFCTGRNKRGHFITPCSHAAGDDGEHLRPHPLLQLCRQGFREFGSRSRG